MRNTNNGSFDFNEFVKSLVFTGVLLLAVAGVSLLLAPDKLPCIELFDNVCTKE